MSHDYAPETRQNRITKRWVAFAPSRSSRPKQTTASGDTPDPTDERPIEGCPFCPGHEDMLPTILWELNGENGDTWLTRAIPNKYPAVRPDREQEPHEGRLHRSRASRGHQEVIIDTPRHHEHLGQMPAPHIGAVLRTYLQRYRSVREEMPAFVPFLFRNHGASAGASITHPHSQLIATDIPAPAVEREERAAHAFYRAEARCPYCEMIEDELKADERLVWTSDHFVAFVPYAAEVPYEIWVLPRRHEPEFGRLGKSERRDLAHGLQMLFSRIYDRLDDPDYNFFVRTALEHESDAPYLHWSLRIQPRTTHEAGFERSTGLRLNPSIPERDAAVLGDD